MPQANVDRAEAVRQQTLAILSSLTKTAMALGLAEPDSSLKRCGKKLTENSYQVLVVGEAKRGKSTFVNALIGRDILPTDVDIATSQVFRISPAEREAYCLRFEDDSRKEIAAADLASYGSQVVADANGVPRLDQIIRWIEVDVPTRFVPANVRILDTPGLGALYAAHAQITDRFVPRRRSHLRPRFPGSHRRAGDSDRDQAPGGDQQYFLHPDEDRPVLPGSLAGDPDAE